MLKVNEYFNGNVKSIGFKEGEGAATVGVIAPGEYEFGTSTIEVMTVISGKLGAMLPGANAWKDFGSGQSFTVSAGQKFKVRASVDTAYLCLYR
jgi:uncharacterized protein YaiE (UPF0345 family)